MYTQRWPVPSVVTQEPLAKPLFPGIKTESDGARIRIGARTPFYFASSSRIKRGSGGGGFSDQTQGDRSVMATTEEATAELFRLARRTAFNIAPEKAEALASEVFGTDDWELRPSRTEA